MLNDVDSVFFFSSQLKSYFWSLLDVDFVELGIVDLGFLS